MNYPQELIEKVEKRTGDAPVEGFVPGQGPLNPKLMLVGEAWKNRGDKSYPF